MVQFVDRWKSGLQRMAENCQWMKSLPEGFDIVKQGAFHSPMKKLDRFFYGQAAQSPFHGQMDQGAVTERGLACWSTA